MHIANYIITIKIKEFNKNTNNDIIDFKIDDINVEVNKTFEHMSADKLYEYYRDKIVNKYKGGV